MPPTPSCPSDQAVWLFLTDPDQLAPGEREHLDTCRRCQGRITHTRQVDLLLPDACAALPGSPSAPLLAGRYQLLEPLGRGGFGEVWLARDTRLGRRVAVKCLRPDRLRPGALDSLRDEARLLGELTEGRAARRHIVAVFDCGEDAGRPFLVLEYVEGGSLGQRVRQFGPLTWRLAARYVADVGEALVEVHRRGLIHRDIKPDNILWDGSADEALLADFGIAAHAVEARGVLSGTPGYLAPELRQGNCSAAADVFALAATLYALLTGQAPFFDEASGDTLESSFDRAECGLALPDPALARVPPAVDEAIRRGLCPDPRRRATLEEFLAQLRGAGAQSLAALVVASSRPTTGAPRPLDLQLDVLAGPSPQVLAPVPTLPAASSYRDLEFVAPEPDCVAVRDGEYVQLRFTSRSGGYLTLLNVGTSGKVAVVFPNPQAPDGFLPPGGTRAVTLRVRPPAGIDEAVGILTHSPGGALPEQWRLQVLAGKAESDPYRAYRDLEFIAEQAEQAPSGEWTAAAVRIAHP